MSVMNATGRWDCFGWSSVANLWDGGLTAPVSRVVTTARGATLRDFPGSFDEVRLA